MLIAKWLPVLVMLARWYGTVDFHTNPREIFLLYPENEPPVYFFYIITYIVLPMYMWERSKMFCLCWRWRVPLLYCIGINIEHLYYDSIIIKNEMEVFDYTLIVITLLIYIYMAISKLLASLLENIAGKLRSGECGMTDEEMEDVFCRLQNLSDGKVTKYEACRILNVSRATFDRMVRDGKLPQGTRQAGCHELFWQRNTILGYRNAK